MLVLVLILSSFSGYRVRFASLSLAVLSLCKRFIPAVPARWFYNLDRRHSGLRFQHEVVAFLHYSGTPKASSLTVHCVESS